MKCDNNNVMWNGAFISRKHSGLSNQYNSGTIEFISCTSASLKITDKNRDVGPKING